MPTAPLNLAVSSTPAMDLRTRRRRYTTLAISLPRVVGAGGLAVGARQHRQLGVLVGQFDQAGDDLVEGRQQHAVAAVTQHQRMGDVVDVFRGAAEVDEFGDAGNFGVVAETLLQPVLHGLHVVVGGGLDGLHGFTVGHREASDHGIQLGDGGGGERSDLGQLGRGGEGLQPFDLDLDAIADQAELGEMLAQRGNLGFVAAVEGRTVR